MPFQVLSFLASHGMLNHNSIRHGFENLNDVLILVGSSSYSWKQVSAKKPSRDITQNSVHPSRQDILVVTAQMCVMRSVRGYEGLRLFSLYQADIVSLSCERGFYGLRVVRFREILLWPRRSGGGWSNWASQRIPTVSAHPPLVNLKSAPIPAFFSDSRSLVSLEVFSFRALF